MGDAMITTIMAGGQTGADMGGLKAAKAVGLATGGWVPADARNEAGILSPETMAFYRLTPSHSMSYAARTTQNVKASDAVLIVADRPGSPGTRLTVAEADAYGRPSLTLSGAEIASPEGAQRVLAWLRKVQPVVLMVAGNRESVAPGIEALTEVGLTLILKGLPRVHTR